MSEAGRGGGCAEKLAMEILVRDAGKVVHLNLAEKNDGRLPPPVRFFSFEVLRRKPSAACKLDPPN